VEHLTLGSHQPDREDGADDRERAQPGGEGAQQAEVAVVARPNGKPSPVTLQTSATTP
jgi:hypothetical protein